MGKTRDFIEKLNIKEALLIESAMQRNDDFVIEDLEEVLPNISEAIIHNFQNGKNIYYPIIRLKIKIGDIMNKHNKNIIKLNMENIDLIQSVIEKNRYKDLLELEKKLPIICGEILVNPMRASRRLEKSMVATYEKLSTQNITQLSHIDSSKITY